METPVQVGAALILVPILNVAINAVAARSSRLKTSSISSKSSSHLASDPIFDHPRPHAEAHHRPMRILAVDDDPFILGLIPGIAAKARYSEVTCAASAKLALATLANTEAQFDCLLFDINMPEMDGIELCRHVRRIAAYRRTPIIMLTGKRDMKSMEQAYLAGATEYATRPSRLDVARRRLRRRPGQSAYGETPTDALVAQGRAPGGNHKSRCARWKALSFTSPKCRLTPNFFPLPKEGARLSSSRHARAISPFVPGSPSTMTTCTVAAACRRLRAAWYSAE